MSADPSSDPGRQRTVAELLAQYSDDSRGGGGRRRRRSADAEPEHGPAAEERPGARSSAEQTWSSFSGLARDDERPAAPAPEPRDQPWPPQGSATAWNSLSGYGEPNAYDPPGSRVTPENTGSSVWARPGTDRASPDSQRREARAFGGTGSYQSGTYAGSGPVNGVYSADSYSAPAPPPPVSVPPPAPAARPAESRRRDDPTEQMPRYTDRSGTSGLPVRPGPSAFAGPPARPPAGRGAQDSGPSTAVSSPAELFDDTAEHDLDDVPDAENGPGDGIAGGPGQPTATRRPAGTPVARRADVPAGLDPEETDVEEHGSGWKAWAVLIGQGIGGAVGGALLWVGFRWLWLHLPVVALAAAVLATAGLVLIVRTIRGSDDLQTTMLAVLVGLIVTISPAVLLLALH